MDTKIPTDAKFFLKPYIYVKNADCDRTFLLRKLVV